MDKAERRQRERDAVRDGKGGDRLYEPPVPCSDEEQSQHEEQMIEAEKDVLDAEFEISGGRDPAARRSGYRRFRRAGRQPLDPRVAAGKRDAHKRVGHGVPQPVDRNSLACERLDRPHAPGLNHRIAGRARDDRAS